MIQIEPAAEKLLYVQDSHTEYFIHYGLYALRLRRRQPNGFDIRRQFEFVRRQAMQEQSEVRQK